MASLTNRHKTVKGKKYNNYNIVESYWDKKEKRSKQKILHKLGNIPDDMAEVIRQQIKGKKQIVLEDLVQKSAEEYGFIHLVFEKAKAIGLEEILGKQFIPTMVMLANRMIDPQSKLECVNRFQTTYLSKTYKQITNKTLYRSLDYLSDEQKNIEDALYQKREDKPQLVIYDITSTYFCGDACEIAEYGYSRDGKPGKKQIVIGLLVDKSGFPLSVEVFPGNTSDTSTMKDKLLEMKNRFGLEDIVVVVDRGMNIEFNLGEASKDDGFDVNAFKYITACKKNEIKDIVKKQYDPSLFEEDTNIEIIDEEARKRYILTYSESRIESDRQQRERAIEKTKKAFQRIQNSIKMGKTKTRDVALEKIGKRKDKWFVGSCFDYEIVENEESFELIFSLNNEAIKKHEATDGLYVIQTNVLDTNEMSKEEVLKVYREKDVVEKAFEVMKSDLNIHPVYHYLESRVRGHVFVCYLAYFLKRVLKEERKKLLQKHTFKSLITELSKVKYLHQHTQKENLSKVIGHTTITKELYHLSNIKM